MQAVAFDSLPDEFDLAVKVHAVVPAAGCHEINFEDIDYTAEGPSVSVVTDQETGADAVDVNDNSRISFPVHCKYRYLALNIKNIDKFVSITLVCKCIENTPRQITLQNKRTNIVVDGNTASIPMKFVEGWQYLNLDIEKMVMNSFGVSCASTLLVSLQGATRVSKIYFQEEPYSDAELPAFLRLVQ